MKEEVQKYILEILVLLKLHIPVSVGNHSFQLGEDGRLWLWIPISGQFQSIIFDEEFENITPADVVDGIIGELKKAGYQL